MTTVQPDDINPSTINDMWEEINDVLRIGNRKRYTCGCVTVYQGEGNVESQVVGCPILSGLRSAYFAARGKVEKYERNKENQDWIKTSQFHANFQKALVDEHNALESLSSHLDEMPFTEEVKKDKS